MSVWLSAEAPFVWTPFDIFRVCEERQGRCRGPSRPIGPEVIPIGEVLNNKQSNVKRSVVVNPRD